MIDRRTFLAGTGAVLLATLVRVTAQPVTGAPGGKMLPRVGYLGSGYPSDRSDPRFSYLFEALADGLRQLGYVDGQTVTMEWRFAEERYERLRELAAELVQGGASVILTPTDHSAVAAREATHTIPIVFSAAADPVRSGFAVSLSRPGRNMTGMAQSGPELTGKRLGLLKEALRNISRVAILRDARQPGDAVHLPVLQDSGRALRLSCQVFEARGRHEWEGVFAAMVKGRAEAVLVLPDTTFYIGRSI